MKKDFKFFYHRIAEKLLKTKISCFLNKQDKMVDSLVCKLCKHVICITILWIAALQDIKTTVHVENICNVMVSIDLH